MCWGHSSVLEGLPRICEDQISRVSLSYTVSYRLVWVIGDSVWKNERGKGEGGKDGKKEGETEKKRRKFLHRSKVPVFAEPKDTTYVTVLML